MSWQKKKLLASLLSLSLLMPTSYIRAEDQTILSQGDKAPFHGVLVPESTYKKMMSDVYEKQFLQSQLDQSLKEKPADDENHEFEWAAAGFVLGFLSTAALVYTLK